MKLWQIVKRSLVTYTLLLIMVDLRYLGLNGKGLIKYKDKFKNYEQ